jgi:hypothetical protein
MRLGGVSQQKSYLTYQLVTVILSMEKWIKGTILFNDIKNI